MNPPLGWQDLRASLDGTVHADRTPGLQVAVVDAAGSLFEHAAGLTDVARGTAISAGSTLMAYSMSKTITAAAVLQLIDQEKLALETPVGSFVPENPYGSAITVRQLLSHTSGVPNPIPLRWVHAAASHATFEERAALARELREHPRLSFAPGTRFRYSNLGYWLLGRIVEEVTGRRFADWVGENVLAPLGLAPRDLGYTIPDPERHAAGYLERWSFLNLLKPWLIDRELVGDAAGRWVGIESHYPNGPAFGGLVGTARAFGRFLQDQLAERSAVLSPAAQALFFEQQRTQSGERIPMTLGWHLGVLDESTYFFKEGGGGGFHSLMRLHRERGFGSVVMTNSTSFNVHRCLDTVDRAAVAATTGR